jgi:ABC-type branched-subunit amino acid transport system substrate-binding protein
LGRTSLLVAAACCLLLASCCTGLPPTVKIGLSAPFEGRDRDLGYEVLHAVRLAVRQRNEAGGAGGALVELVALNDFNEGAEAVVQARKMAVDPGVLAVVGGWTANTVAAAAPEYKRLGLAFLAPDAEFAVGSPPVEDAPFAADYEALSGGAPPGPAAAWAYEATQRILDTIEAASRGRKPPTRDAVSAALDGP